MKKKKWEVRYLCRDNGVETRAKQLAEEMNITFPMARLLVLRNLDSKEKIQEYFGQTDVAFYDPYLLKDMETAVKRLENALEKREKICVYGDYDVDGVTATTVLYLYLSERNADVIYYIPDRKTEGYGLSRSAVDTVSDFGVNLIVTVDNGITSFDEVLHAKDRGMDVIITDHHECLEALPDCVAIVNPCRPDDTYPYSHLAGVGVSFKLACALEMAKAKAEQTDVSSALRKITEKYIDLVAIGTVADVMPLTGENRLIVTAGLRILEKNPRMGLRALMDSANAGKTSSKKGMTANYIGFTVAPRMNAAGRVAHASIAVELLLSDEEEKAKRLAEKLCELNAERQVSENHIMAEAERKMETDMEVGDKFILLSDDHWQQGIIGIVASRLTEKYGLPTILVTFDGSVNGTPEPGDAGKGSGRSIPGFNLVEALSANGDLLSRYGGHELAAGLSVARRNVYALQRRLNARAEELLTEDILTVTLTAEFELSTNDLTLSFAKELLQMEPFGVENPMPKFLLKDAKILSVQSLSGGKHTKITVDKDGKPFCCLWFGKETASFPFAIGDRVDLLFEVSINEFRGDTTVQLMLSDMAPTQMDCAKEKEQYLSIREGAQYDKNLHFCPDRQDIATVYTYLKKCCRNKGQLRFMTSTVLSDLPNIGYVKLKLIYDILNEMHLVECREDETERYCIIFPPDTVRVNLEDSAMLRQYRLQEKGD